MNIEVSCQGTTFIEIPGLPTIRENRYNQKEKPPSISNLLKSKDGFFEDFQCGKFDISLIKHIGETLVLSKEHHLKKNEHYLDLNLQECSDLKEAIFSLHQLAQFVKEYPGVSWLVGSTWIGSVANGRLIERYGFHQTNIDVPLTIQRLSKKTGTNKKNANPTHIKTVKQSNVVFIYAQRDEFLSKFHV